MTSPSHVDARVSRRFQTDAQPVFDAWLDPTMIGAWMFGPAWRDEEVVRISVDARAGGAFSFVVRRDGKELDHTGEYLEIERPKRLVFTWGVREEGQAEPADSSRVVVEVEARGPGSEVILTHEMDAAWAHFVSQAEAAWSGMLDALAITLGEATPDKAART